MNDRGHLTTEHANDASVRIDRMTTGEAFDLLNRQDAAVATAVAQARTHICEAVDLVVAALSGGGRLIYVGAGTSGRLGVLDAAECPPTFLSNPTDVHGIIAGGIDALTRSIEGAEDAPEDGAAAIDQCQIAAADVVFGITAGGTTPFVHGALARAKTLGARTVFFACVPHDQVTDDADVSIRVITGPEVITGSTRMKAGTATKMVLNAVTTISMVRSGKVYRNLMVDVNTSANAKLVDRGTRIIQSLTGLDRTVAGALLAASGGHVKTALVMHAKQLDRDTARALLAEHHGHLSAIIDGAVPSGQEVFHG